MEVLQYFGGKHIALNAYIRKEKRVKFSAVSFCLKTQHIKHKESRSQQILKMRAKITKEKTGNNRENPEGFTFGLLF